MQRLCAHRWNPRGHSWTGPSRALTRGSWPSHIAETQPSPTESYRQDHKMKCNEIAAKKRKRRKNTRILAFFAPFCGYSRLPAALREDFGNEGYEDSQTRITNTAESSQIVPNPGKSSQIVPMNIVLQGRPRAGKCMLGRDPRQDDFHIKMTVVKKRHFEKQTHF